MRSEPDSFVSVIIPVLNDFERLRACLRALEGQTYPKDLYEVVVVDNGSDENPEPLVSEFGQARVSYEERSGSYAARNRGLSVARGAVIAFTDSDCIPAQDWIERGVEKLLSVPGCGLVAGRIEVFFKDPRHPTTVELYESVMAFPQRQYVEHYRFGATANMFTFSSVFEVVGMFNDELLSGGDRDWGERVCSYGYEQAYAEAACVYHPARRSFDQLRKKVARVAGGIHVLRSKKSSFLGLNRQFFTDFVPPVKQVRQVFVDERLSSTKNKVRVSLLVLFVKYMRIWERLRHGLAAKLRS